LGRDEEELINVHQNAQNLSEMTKEQFTTKWNDKDETIPNFDPFVFNCAMSDNVGCMGPNLVLKLGSCLIGIDQENRTKLKALVYSI